MRIAGSKTRNQGWNRQMLVLAGMTLLLTGPAWAGAVGSEFRANTYTANQQEYPSVAMDSSGNFVVAWRSAGQDGSGYGVYAQRYNALGVAQGSEFRVNTYTTDDQNHPSAAMDSSGNFVVAWQSAGQDGDGDGVYAQRYNASGVTQGSEFRVNTYTTSGQARPSVAMDFSGNFVVAWDSRDQDGSSYGVYAQRYNASGVAQGSEFLVNTYTTSPQLSPSVAMDSSGNFVIAWQSYGQDGSVYGVYAQRYNASGVAQGSEFVANTYTANSQSTASVAMDSSGNFVIAWQSDGQDGSGYGVYAQRYNASGVAQGSEFQVNAYTASVQSYPSVAMDSLGNFVVTWSSDGQDGSSYGVYAQRYNASGVAQGGEFQVNAYTTDYQWCPTAAMDSSGNFVLAWSSNGQDGSGYGVYAQRYDHDFEPPAVPVIASPNSGSDYTTSDDSPVAISGTCASDTDSIEVNGSTSGVAYTPGETSWSYTSSTLSEGANVFDVTATDAANNTSDADSITITLDTAPPAVPVIISPNGGSDYVTSDDSPVTVSGTCASDTNAIEVNGSTSSVTYTSGGTDWSYTSGTLSEGANPFGVIALDAVSNASDSNDISITLDTTGPDAPVMDAEPVWTSGTENTVSWGAAGDAVSYTVEYDDADDFATPLGSATLAAPPLEHTFTGLSDGVTYWYHVRGEDALGNPGDWSIPVSSAQNTATLSVDTPGTSTVNAITGEPVTFQVSVSDENGTVSYQWYKVGSAKADIPVGTGSPSYTIDAVALEDAGQYYCEVSDAADTVLSPLFTLTVEAGVPAAGLTALGLLVSLVMAIGASALRRKN